MDKPEFIKKVGIIRDYPDSHHWLEDRKILAEWWKKRLDKLRIHISEHAFMGD